MEGTLESADHGSGKPRVAIGVSRRSGGLWKTRFALRHLLRRWLGSEG